MFINSCSFVYSVPLTHFCRYNSPFPLENYSSLIDVFGEGDEAAKHKTIPVGATIPFLLSIVPPSTLAVIHCPHLNNHRGERKILASHSPLHGLLKFANQSHTDDTDDHSFQFDGFPDTHIHTHSIEVKFLGEYVCLK